MDLFSSSEDSSDRVMDPTLDLPQDNCLDETQGVSSSENSNAGENTGRWTAEEHRLFLQGLEQHGKGWKKIASLIKSRTVVQIRTHAQKYFQKLAKSKQVGDDSENACVSGGVSSSVAHGRGLTGRSLQAGDAGSSSYDGKRRKNPLSGTKRKAISSVVASALRERKRSAMESSSDPDAPKLHLSAVAPTLVPFVKLTRISSTSSEDTSTTTLSGSILEESLFRFLTPHPGYPNDAVTRGSNGLTLSSTRNKAIMSETGKEDPTNIHDPLSFPTWIWTDYKAEPSSWYERGGDVDELLNDADALDWLADTGDLNESYEATSQKKNDVPSHLSEPSLLSLPLCDPPPIQAVDATGYEPTAHVSMNSPSQLKMISSSTMMGIGSLPSLSSSASLFASATDHVDNFPIFEAPFDEQAFVTSLLENPSESFNNLSSF